MLNVELCALGDSAVSFCSEVNHLHFKIKPPCQNRAAADWQLRLPAPARITQARAQWDWRA